MRILFDEDMPRPLKKNLTDHQVFTVQELGWSGIKNGELLKRANSQFDVFLTADKSLQYQQNLKRLDISIIVFPSTQIDIVLGLTERLLAVLQNITRGDLIVL